MAKNEQNETELMSCILSWHLTNNIKPAVPDAFIDPAIEAILACREDQAGKMILLPFGLLVDGRGEVSAGDLVEDLRLWDMVN